MISQKSKYACGCELCAHPFENTFYKEIVYYGPYATSCTAQMFLKGWAVKYKLKIQGRLFPHKEIGQMVYFQIYNGKLHQVIQEPV